MFLKPYLKCGLFCLLALALVVCLWACGSKTPVQEESVRPGVATEEVPVTTTTPAVVPEKPPVVLNRPADLYQPWQPPQRTVPADSSVTKLAAGEYPVFTDDMDFNGLDYAISQSLAYFARIPGERVFKAADTTFTKTEIERGLWKFKDFLATGPSVSQLNAFVRENFDVYQSKGRSKDREVMFTGYFEPIYRGSLTPDSRYQYPVYSRPKDLIQDQQSREISRLDAGGNKVPYYTRAEIETTDALKNQCDVLVWLESPLDAFFLHVQGSGRVILPDGQSFHLNFDVKNGRDYKSLGALLIDGGHMTKEEMSMQGIYDFFAQNPAKCRPILHQNNSYVFFRAETEGPFGSLAVPITPGRTLALDRDVFPPGILLMAQTYKPTVNPNDSTIENWYPITRLMLNQDAGGAIKGPGRADFFWGSGTFAAIAAGYMKHSGKLYFFLPRN